MIIGTSHIFWCERSAHIQGGGTTSTRIACVSQSVLVHYRAHPWRRELLGEPVAALGDASGRSGVRARERQVRGGAFRWERQVSDEGGCARRAGGRCGGRAHPRYGVGGGFARFRTAVPGGVPRPPCDLGAGQGRVSEEATAGVCPPGGGRTPRVDAIMARLEWHCVWEGMAGDVRDMTRLCLYCCADTKAGALVPCTLEETPHGREPNAIVRFDFLYMVESAVDVGVDAADGSVRAINSHSRGREWIHMAATV